MPVVFNNSLKKGIPKVKEFGGVMYRLEEFYLKKSSAQVLAKQIRAQGGKARVVEISGYFCVYYN